MTDRETVSVETRIYTLRRGEKIGKIDIDEDGRYTIEIVKVRKVVHNN